MQDLLKKIIEMDRQARKIEQAAKSEKLKSEEEVEKLKEQIYNDYIARAKKRVEQNIAVDQANAEKRLAAYKERTDAAGDEMNRLYQENKDAWIESIVKRSLA